ncbi:MAG TPA: rhomboid family intramembrane serine protease [Opitutales bacterium]|nr:rhomboid family intramembrane serine protease [Opitutales bacterium]
MDTNVVLLWLVLFFAFSAAIRFSRFALTRVDAGLYGAVGLISIGLWFTAPNVAGYVSALLIALLSLPSWWLFRIRRLVLGQQYAAAARLAEQARWLRPTPLMWHYPTMLWALDAGSRGDRETAMAMLERYQTSKAPIARVATAQGFRMQGDWESLLTWLAEESVELALYPDILPLALRAWGETGQVEQLATAYQRYYRTLAANPANLQLGRLFLLAFTGKTEAVRKILAMHLTQWPDGVKDFWVATAELAAGHEEEGRRMLESIRSDDQMLRAAIQRRLAQPLSPTVGAISSVTWHFIESLEHTMSDEVRYGPLGARAMGRPNITYALIAANIAVFIAETVHGGSENTDTLYQLGGLWPPAVLQGEWWRVGTALFLHAGPMHIAMNMYGLYLLGPFVEAALGRVRYAVGYFGSGIASMLFIVIAAKLGWMQDELVIGASGAIMGIVGMTGAIMLLARRSKVAAQRLKSVVIIIVIQAIFDQTVPNISAVGHMSGAAAGFLLGLLLAWTKPAKSNE